jgi:hypothetical protein
VYRLLHSSKYHNLFYFFIVFEGKQLKNDSCILDHGLTDGDRIDIVMRMDASIPIHEDVEYSSFVQSISPKDGEIVSRHPSIPLLVLNGFVLACTCRCSSSYQFWTFPFWPVRSYAGLSDYESLSTTAPHGGDMVRSLEGNLQDAIRRGELRTDIPTSATYVTAARYLQATDNHGLISNSIIEY